jgi:hypothetical protein
MVIQQKTEELQQKPQEPPQLKFICYKCNFKTTNKKDYTRHLATKKHNTTEITHTILDNNMYRCLCGKEYKHRGSIHNHKKKCNYKEEIKEEVVPQEIKEEIKEEVKEEVKQEVNYKELILTLINQNKELQDLLISQQEEFMKKQQELLISQQEEYRKEQQEQKKELKNLILHIKPSVNKTNCNNKTIKNNFNIMMFLNDKCKDAMTIQDFAERLVVTIEDLEKKKFDCLTNTILKNLKSLGITERPVHCGNIKRKEWYLNHKDKGWEIDNGEKLIQNAEFGINKKFQNEFIKHYPNYSTNENIKDKYMRLINRTFTDLPENEKSRLLNILSSDLLLEE